MTDPDRMTYARTSARLLGLCRAPDVPLVVFTGVKVLRGFKSKHRADMARRWRMFWRLKRYAHIGGKQ